MLPSPAFLLSLAIVATLVATARLSPAPLQETQANSRQKRDSKEEEQTVDLQALNDFHESLRSLEDSYIETQKKSCNFGLGNHCFTSNLDSYLKAKDYLSSGASPGKRATGIPQDIKTRAEEVLESLNEQMKAVATLRTLLNRLGEQVKHVKRTCQFRLGNHCLTEELDRAARQYYYLMSPKSPGRRKRTAEGGAESEDLGDGEEDTVDLSSRR